MKIRVGFVSNSSSSSYVCLHFPVVIDEDTKYKYHGKSLMIPDDFDHPVYGFGWDYHEWDKFEDKLCFALIQARYLDDPDDENLILSSDQIGDGFPHFKKIFEVLQEVLNTPRVYFALFQKKPNGEDIFHYYIDHQSAAYEGQNKEMFDSKENMISFLFDSKSYINGGNDNEEN